MKHGFPTKDWDKAKEETRNLLKKTAGHKIEGKRRISYSEVAANILGIISLDAHDPRLGSLLGEISVEEFSEGKGMLSVIVTHKSGDMMPGKGFFELAGELGYDVSDEVMFWADEFKKVCGYWSKKV